MLSFWNKHTQHCLPQFLWRGRHFITCESLGSSPVKMSQAFHDPSICFNFLYRRVNTFKTPEMCLYLDSDIAPDVYIIFPGSFIILSRFLAESWSVKMSQASHDPSINLHRTWPGKGKHVQNSWNASLLWLRRLRRMFHYFCWIFSLFQVSYQN